MTRRSNYETTALIKSSLTVSFPTVLISPSLPIDQSQQISRKVPDIFLKFDLNILSDCESHIYNFSFLQVKVVPFDRISILE